MESSIFTVNLVTLPRVTSLGTVGTGSSDQAPFVETLMLPSLSSGGLAHFHRIFGSGHGGGLAAPGRWAGAGSEQSHTASTDATACHGRMPVVVMSRPPREWNQIR